MSKIQEGERFVSKANTGPNWVNCPSTHCERREECCSPSDCCVKTTGRRALVPAFQAHLESEYGGKLQPVRWDERHGGLPYRSVDAQRFRDFMAGFDAARQALASEDSPQ